MIAKSLFVFTFLITKVVISQEHTIAYFFSPPRSLSVVCMRMMESYGFTAIHEPSTPVHDGQQFPEWFLPNAPKSYAQVKTMILKAAETNSVCVKEMAVNSIEAIIEDKVFFSKSNIFPIFLIRNPHHAIISLYNRFNEIGNFPAYECGYQAMHDLFKFLKIHAENKPLLILTEDLYEQPEQTAQKICIHLKIPFKPAMLHWNDLGEDFTGHEQWNETKHKQYVHHWHGQAIRSTEIKKPTSYQIDEEGNPTFIEVADEHRSKIHAFYEENKIYYDLLKAMK